MTQELKEDLSIPGVYATLVAAQRPGTKDELVALGVLKASANYFGWSRRQRHQVIDWSLRLYISGPDSRYAGALGEVNSAEHQRFVEALRQGLRKVESLESRTFTGDFTSSIPFKGAPELSVVASGGQVKLVLGLKSRTLYTWTARFSRADLVRLIATVESLSTRGPALCDTLRQLI